MGNRRNGGSGVHALSQLAASQHGVVSRRQLRTLGLTDRKVTSLTASGWLHPVFRGTFAVGHAAIGRKGRMAAAVLACGGDAVVSHWTAAELLGLWDRQAGQIHVITSSEAGRKIADVRPHFVRAPRAEERTVCDGIPSTTPSRTLVDLAGGVGEWSMRRFVERAAAAGMLDVAAIERILASCRRRGAPTLRAALSPWRMEELPRLRSPLEARLLAAVVEAGLPRPRCNVALRVDDQLLEVDLLWDAQRLIVETDGEETHGHTGAFRRDRWRDQLLVAAGYRIARVTWGHLEDEPDATLARLRRMLEPLPAPP